MDKQEFIEKASAYKIRDSDNPIIMDLIKDGISIQRNFFKEDQYKELLRFSAYIEKSVELDGSGYIYSVRGMPYLEKQLDHDLKRYNDGQIRLQSKTVGIINGSLPLISDKRIVSVFQHIYNTIEIDRQTLEWIIPADINHNPWHIDSPLDELKAMILLSDVQESDAPMYYAKGSHNYQTEIEKDIKYKMYSMGYTNNPNTRKHYGYLEKEDISKILSQYEIIKCTGSPGDVIFFFSNGFHSGNKSTGKTRKDIVLSTTKGTTKKNEALKK